MISFGLTQQISLVGFAMRDSRQPPNSVTGFSVPFVTLAVGLRLARTDYRDACASAHADFSIEAIEGPKARAFAVVLLNAALCESIINTYLAIHIEAKAWSNLERKPPLIKWSKILCQVWPNYSLDDPMLCELKLLFGFRDSIMHAKAEIWEGCVNRHPGNWNGHSKEVVEASFDISLRLLENLRKHDYSVAIYQMQIRQQFGQL